MGGAWRPAESFRLGRAGTGSSDVPDTERGIGTDRSHRLAIGGFVCLLRPIMHGLQGQVPFALPRRIEVCVSPGPSTERRGGIPDPIGTTRSDACPGTAAGGCPSPKDCGRSSVCRFNSLRSAPVIWNGDLRSYVPGCMRSRFNGTCRRISTGGRTSSLPVGGHRRWRPAPLFYGGRAFCNR